MHTLALNRAQHSVEPGSQLAPSLNILSFSNEAIFQRTIRGNVVSSRSSQFLILESVSRAWEGGAHRENGAARVGTNKLPTSHPSPKEGQGPAQLRIGRTAPANLAQTPRGSKIARTGQGQGECGGGGHPSDPGARAQEKQEKSQKAGAGKGAPFTG